MIFFEHGSAWVSAWDLTRKDEADPQISDIRSIRNLLTAPLFPRTGVCSEWGNGRWSLCPENAGRSYYNVHFIETPIEITAKQGEQAAVVDPKGLMFVAHEEEEAIRGNNDLKLPLGLSCQYL